MSFAINNIVGNVFNNKASKPTAQNGKSTSANAYAQDQLQISSAAKNGLVILPSGGPTLNPLRQQAEDLAQKQVDFDQQALDADKAALAKADQDQDPLGGFQKGFLAKFVKQDQLKLDQDKLSLETMKSQDMDQTISQDEQAVNNASSPIGKSIAQWKLSQDQQAQQQMQVQIAKDTVAVDQEQVQSDQAALQDAQGELDMWNSMGHTPEEFNQRAQLQLQVKEAQQRLDADKTQQQIDQQSLDSLTKPPSPIFYAMDKAS